MRLTRSMGAFSLAVAVLSVAGCSSSKSYKVDMERRKLTIVTEPAGAEVHQTFPLGQPSVRLGTTPIQDLNVMVIQGMKFDHLSPGEAQDALRYCQNVGVEIRKDGFKPYRGFLAADPDPPKEHRIVLERVAGSAVDSPPR